MEHKLPQLPYELDALSPHLSRHLEKSLLGFSRAFERSGRAHRYALFAR